MLKKFNIILIFFAGVLSVKLGIGFTLFLPLLIFYLLKDFKNIYYTYIPSLLSCFLLAREYLISLLIVLCTTLIFYYLYVYIVNKAKRDSKLNTISIGIYMILINVLVAFIFHKAINNISLILITNVISVILYLYLEKYLYQIIKENCETMETMLSSVAYLEIMISIVAIIGASTITLYKINLGFVYSIFYAMYFGRRFKNVYSLIYGTASLIILFLGFNISEALFIPFISALYLISNMLLLLLLNGILTVILFSNTGYEMNMLISIMIVSVIYELIAPLIIDEKKTDAEIFEYIYSQIQKNTNDEMLNFSLFLDKFSQGFQNPKEYNERLSDGIKSLVQNHCNNCDKRKACFDKYKIELYEVFKSLILQEPNFRINYPEFCSYCSKISNFEMTAKLLESQIKAPNQEIHTKTNNNILLAQINGVSNAIKKYVLDMASKEELSYYQVILIKKKLLDYGYDVTYFDVVKLFENDFNFKIGLKDVNFNDAAVTTKLIVENIIKHRVSIVLENKERDTIYINIIPELKIDITYGYGALSCDGEEICGDNYLIKEINNGHFISAISDGMGKGYRAFYESDMTLRLVEDIIKLNLSTSTALEILNSFYAIQDYLEQYATLDFLEINRYNKTANFYKMGATTTYIFKADGSIEQIINKSLPFGLDEEVDSYSYELSNGDLILMSSDGIFENIINETQLQEFIESIKNLPPQRIVYELLNYTINNKIKTKDDMSIIALKIQEAA